MTQFPEHMPEVRGRLTPQKRLDDLTWLRVGGPADWFFMPADREDLAQFMRDLPETVPVFPMGVGSNLIVRDGGLRAVVIRLGRGFNGIEIDGNRVIAGSRGAGFPCRTESRRSRRRSGLFAHNSGKYRRGRAHECGMLRVLRGRCPDRGNGDRARRLRVAADAR